MKRREPLKQNTELRVTNYEGGSLRFVIGEVVGLGGSCIVYDGSCRDNTGASHTVRIKECYPYNLDIARSETGVLVADGHARAAFEACKERARASFALAGGLHKAAGLTNRTAHLFDCYEANQTVYTVSAYVEGRTLADICFDSLQDAVRAVAATAKSIECIHRQGYLYLDAKPENILVYEETPELVLLFDFDSVIPIGADEHMMTFRLGFTDGFAPYEQKLGDLSRIGKYSDVYGVGALLFFLLFGRAPRAADCGREALYEYDEWKWKARFQDRLYHELTIFFHNTLQAYGADRYQDMEEAVTQLELIGKYAGLDAPFLCDSRVFSCGDIVGRESECSTLLDWCHSGERLIFVTGMGGIGKSTVVRKFVSDHREEFAHVVYVQYHDSVCSTMTDDAQFCINGCAREADETAGDYFARKMKTARALTEDGNTLLVIDNFEGAWDADFAELLRAAWKIIVVTRADRKGTGSACLRIGEMESKTELRQLFECHMGRGLRAEEHQRFARIAELASGHTLLLVLLARQIAKSRLNLDEALALVEQNGFSGMSPEKIDYMQDGKLCYDRMSAILKAVMDVSALSEEKKTCLKLLSLFDAPGIDVRDAQALLKLPSLDEINELGALGWLEIPERTVQMHPLIRETALSLDWTKACRELVSEGMRVLCGEITGSGRTGKNRGGAADSERLFGAFATAKSLLRRCGRDECLRAEASYRELLLATLLNLPGDEEAYILAHAREAFDDSECENLYAVMELYDYVVYLLCQQKNFAEAEEYINEAASFAGKRRDHYILGLYDAMQNDFCDALLDGAYASRERGARSLVKKMLRTSDRAIWHMRRSSHKNAKKLCAGYVLGKALLLIRSAPEKKRAIRALILQAERMPAHAAPEDGQMCAAHRAWQMLPCPVEMAWAWYDTLCAPDKAAVLRDLARAGEAFSKRTASELEWIDELAIPAANMMCELADDARAFFWLEQAIRVCDAHADVVPYVRKKLDLLTFKLEICYYDGYEEEYERVRLRIDAANREAAEYHIIKEIPDTLSNVRV